MRIQHNIAALNSYRQLSGNNSAVAKNLEKLSSGYRINRAGDDAAGLAISEKMRAQITGLETAQKNANDGISLVQTAEGALTEVHSMLNRMVELATQSANGTYDNSVDRANLQKEFDSLLEEVDRISDATNFNGINLLDGSLGGAKVASTTGTASVNGAAGTTATIAGGAAALDGHEKASTAGNKDAKFTLSFTPITVKDAANNDVKGVTEGKVAYKIFDKTFTIDVSEGMDAKAIANALKEKIGTNPITLNDGANDAKFTVAVTAGGALEFTQSEVGAFDKIEAGDITVTPTAGKIGAKARVDGAASKAVLDFDGRAGGDFLGGTVTIGKKTYAFVEKTGDAKNGETEVVIAKNATSKEVATALAQAAQADTNFTVAADVTDKK